MRRAFSLNSIHKRFVIFMAKKPDATPSIFDHLKEEDSFDLWGRSGLSTALNKAKPKAPDNEQIAAARKLIKGNTDKSA